MRILILSCDKYEPCWKPFFALLDKYYPNHPECYLVTETKRCQYCPTINVNNPNWTTRFRCALEIIDDDEVLVMLDDFFIRKPVDEDRINRIKFTDDIICYNFELKYRDTVCVLTDDWEVQRNNQVYLNSCQPTIWNREKLMNRLDGNLNPQQWEVQTIDSPYLHLINSGDFIIDVGYRHQDLSIGWGITRGRLAKECYNFLESEGLLSEDIINSFPIL